MNYQTIKTFDSINQIVKHNSIQIPYKTKFTVRHKIVSSTCEFPVPLTAAQIFNVQLKIVRANFRLSDSGGAEYNQNQRSPMYANDFWEIMNSPSAFTNSVVPSFKVKIGDYYYPQYNPNQIQDYYVMTTEALNPMNASACNDVDPQYNKSSIGCVSYTDYSFSMAQFVPMNIQAVEYGLSTGGCIMAFDLRRNKDLGLSGITTNSQRKLSVILSGMDAIDDASIFNVFITVEYLQILEYKDGKITIMK
jgi:hypothetical protein